MNFSSLFEIIRKSTYPRASYLLLLIFLFSSCVGTKFLKEDEKVLNKYTVKGIGSTGRGYIEPLQEQQPNTRFLLPSGPAHLVYIYEFGKDNFLFKYDTNRIESNKQKIIQKYDAKIEKASSDFRKDRLLSKKLRKVSKKDRALTEGNQIMRWGEPIAVYDSTATVATVDHMRQFLNSRGYYSNKIKAIEEFNGKKVNLVYDVDKGEGYTVDSIIYYIPDYHVRDLIFSFDENEQIKKGKLLQQRDLSAERTRIYDIMVNNGYYAFTKDLVYYEIDTVSLEKGHVILKEIIASPEDSYYHKVYVVDSVIFVTDSGVGNVKNLANQQKNNVTYTFGRFHYSSKILDWHNQLYPGKVYQRNLVTESQRQLSYLDNFKFINVNFDTLGTQFIAHIFTSPADRFQTSTEAGLSVTQGLPGPFASVNLKNRNLFRGLEITELNSYFKVEGLGGVSTQTRTYSSLQYGTELSITFPQFLSPLGKFYKKKIAQYNPRSRFSLAFNREDRLNEYSRSSFSASTAYIWKVKDHISYTVTPMDISYINSKTDSTFQAFLNELALSGNTYANTFRSSFVSAGSAQVTINNNYGGGSTSTYAQFFVEFGGHLRTLIDQTPFGKQLEYFNYSKFKVDLRRNIQLHPRQSIATRLNLGVAVPYGDNNSLPYERYFFAGGSNSIRAWRPRRLGPGSYGETNADGSIDYQREQPGDILLETSVELRQKLSGFVDFALFVDAGNIWLLRSRTVDASDDPQGDQGKFKFDSFASEIAVGAGYGLRADLSFLIFRLDLGYKIVDPARAKGSRWVAGENDILDFNQAGWFRPFKNATFNIGIGFPF